MNSFKFNTKPKVKSHLDPNFNPAILAHLNFEKSVLKTNQYNQVEIGIKRAEDDISVHKTVLFSDDHIDASQNEFFIERLIKALLWTKGGYQILIKGPESIKSFLKKTYTKDGLRSFDVLFMERIYEKPFEVVSLKDDEVLEEKEVAKSV